MSWFSEFLNGGGDQTSFTPDPNFTNWATGGKPAVDAAAVAQAETDRLAALRDAAVGTAHNSANQYFTSHGVDPGAYSGDIDARINEILGSISSSDPTPGAAFNGIGEDVFGRASGAARDRATRGVDTAFAPGFESARIGDTLDDPILADIQKTQRGSADQIIQNMLKRGVVTSTGATAGEASLDKQDPRVRSMLDQLGGGVLEGGRDKLRGIADTARSRAATLNLGQSFDPATFTGQADTSFNDFMSKLSDSIKGQTPEGLYDTSGLAAAAGAGQGAQNTAFDPKALAGIISPDNTDDTTKPKKASASPF